MNFKYKKKNKWEKNGMGLDKLQRTVGFCVFLLISNILIAQNTIFPKPLSDRTANYIIDLELDTETKIFSAKETVIWKNPSPDTIRELQFHLYYNAFKNNQSCWLSEAGGVPQHALRYEDSENIWAWSDIEHFEDETGYDLTNNLKFIHPDDDNLADQTVVAVKLNKPVLPYQTDTFKLNFTAKMPKAMVRTGYSANYFHAVQWFPKLGVYEPAGMRCSEKGAWNCHQYHRAGEYYANFGNYDVRISLPDNYVVGASGLKVREMEINGMKTHHYHAEDVIDFAWSASPDFVEIKDEWEGVDIRLLIHPEHEYLSWRYVTSLKNALEYYATHLEKYPFPNITIVVPPFHGVYTSSMEYPTLFTSPAIWGLPEDIRLIETITVHEFTHQYFMMMVASNEMEEAWLDEGFTTYWEGRIMDKYYGKQTSSFNILGFRAGNEESTRVGYVHVPNPKVAPISRQARNFKHGGYRFSYDKTGVILKTLEGLVGVETNAEIWKTYFNRWKFNHPCGEDFISIVNEIVSKNHGTQFGENLDWFFEPLVYGTAQCDYDVAFIQNVKVTAPFGILEDKNNPVSSDVLEEKSDSLLYDSKVVLYRLGEVILPQEVLIGFEGGEEILEYWDGKERSFEFTYQKDKKMEYVLIDPHQKNQYDNNFINNSLTLKPKKTGIQKYASKFMIWMQNALVTMSLFS